jgi:hypothetical protein
MTQLSRRLAAAAMLLPALSAQADETGFLKRFDGAWSGTGLVQRKIEEGPHQVSCKMTGAPTSDGVSISGVCRAAVIFSRQIRADLRYDPGSGRYSGTYVGAKVGPARLSGKRNGDAVILTIFWPKPVNGDKTATMTIRNPGDGNLRIVVAAKPRPGGSNAEVTNLALAQN